jgi:glutathione S-transferase
MRVGVLLLATAQRALSAVDWTAYGGDAPADGTPPPPRPPELPPSVKAAIAKVGAALSFGISFLPSRATLNDAVPWAGIALVAAFGLMAFMGALRKLGLAGGQRRLSLFLFLQTVAYGAATFLAGMWLERVLAGTRLRVVVSATAALTVLRIAVARAWRAFWWPRRVTLMYFNIDGLGEPIRLALAQAGVPFDDHRFKEGEFAKVKPTLAFGQVPCLVVDGREIVQTASILRYVGKVLDGTGTLYPADAAVAQRVDAMMDQTKDMMTGRMAHKYRERFGFGSLDDKAVAEVEAAWFASTLPRHLAFFEKALAESGSGWLVGSRTPTAADFLVGCQLRAFEKTCADKVTMPAALAAYTERLFALPAVAKFKAGEKKAA